MNATDLVGTWELLSYYDIDEQDTTSRGPLGDSPRGLLIYSAHGYMSVSMMRTDGAPGANPFMGYAGTWRRSGTEMVHAISVCSNPAWAQTEQVRQMSLNGDVLTLIGSAQVGGRTQRRVLTWRRSGPPA
ncbi:lipocalin-like domain-containing protein [Nocardia abscessus]|uniref:lipocalin-like domain-containing protein n=1 Tax=Nocardia abscessus TaxID=120957 RepID=UPI0005B87DD0|nr:lipocalin-like domain-containing protein [Nocardia abscessus]MCC3330444.1 lipocalin-like domain-containing protein [Nocardia abscessus]